jgi:hypothetical protein
LRGNARYHITRDRVVDVSAGVDREQVAFRYRSPIKDTLIIRNRENDGPGDEIPRGGGGEIYFCIK